MANKKASELADVALNEKKEDKPKKVILIPVGSFGHNPFYGNSSPFRFVQYPPSVTDQIHASSIAEMVKQGQGAIGEEDMNNFDFPDGKDDGKLKGHSLSELEWADPAERYENEAALNAEIGTAIRREVSEKAEKMMAERAEKAVKNNAKTGTDNPVSSEKSE